MVLCGCDDNWSMEAFGTSVLLRLGWLSAGRTSGTEQKGTLEMLTEDTLLIKKALEQKHENMDRPLVSVIVAGVKRRTLSCSSIARAYCLKPIGE